MLVKCPMCPHAGIHCWVCNGKGNLEDSLLNKLRKEQADREEKREMKLYKELHKKYGVGQHFIVESEMAMTENYITHRDIRGNTIKEIGIGCEVENDDARFFVGSINDSRDLCSIDKTKPFTLKNKNSPMARCIEQGNYSASAETLSVVPNAEITDSNAGLDNTLIGEKHADR